MDNNTKGDLKQRNYERASKFLEDILKVCNAHNMSLIPMEDEYGTEGLIELELLDEKRQRIACIADIIAIEPGDDADDCLTTIYHHGGDR